MVNTHLNVIVLYIKSNDLQVSTQAVLEIVVSNSLIGLLQVSLYTMHVLCEK